MQGWRRLKQSIAGARDSQPLLVGFGEAQGEQLVRLPAIGVAAEEAKVMSFHFCTHQLLGPDFYLL